MCAKESVCVCVCVVCVLNRVCVCLCGVCAEESVCVCVCVVCVLKSVCVCICVAGASLQDHQSGKVSVLLPDAFDQTFPILTKQDDKEAILHTKPL